jgi:hypothetical protein
MLMPVRKVSNHGKNIIGYFPSIKMGRMVAFESTIERDLIYDLDFSPHVVAFHEQPLEIHYWKNRKRRKYIPDFQVHFISGNCSLMECKPLALVNSEENKEKFEIAQVWASDQGWEFEVVTDASLREGFWLENIKFLTQFARYEISPLLKYNILAFINLQQDAPSILEVIHGIPSENIGLVRTAIFQLVYFHELSLSLDDEVIHNDMKIRIKSVEEKK